jgi:hypothetical protein
LKLEVVHDFFYIIAIDFNCCDVAGLIIYGPHTTSTTHMLLSKLHQTFDIFLAF